MIPSVSTCLLQFRDSFVMASLFRQRKPQHAAGKEKAVGVRKRLPSLCDRVVVLARTEVGLCQL